MPSEVIVNSRVSGWWLLRDTLLRLAELELYAPLWSARIIEEMTRNLVEHRITAERAARVELAMRAAFEDAEVDASEIDRWEPAMTNDPKDRHVLAAAVAADSELIVTFDLDDFPAAACDPLGVEALHPDDFLLDLHDLRHEASRIRGFRDGGRRRRGHWSWRVAERWHRGLSAPSRTNFSQ